MTETYKNILSTEETKLIRRIPECIQEKFYLGGGTGLALQIGHRYSHDFDFFSDTEFNNDVIIKEIAQLGEFRLFQESRGTLEGTVKNTRITFLYYNYPLLKMFTRFEKIRLASLIDIAVMKISALSARGSRKDFIDLYFLKDYFKWDEELIPAFKEKYKGTGYNVYHIIKSLSYFKEAEQEPMPQMIRSFSWSDVVQYFENIQKELADIYL